MKQFLKNTKNCGAPNNGKEKSSEIKFCRNNSPSC